MRYKIQKIKERIVLRIASWLLSQKYFVDGYHRKDLYRSTISDLYTQIGDLKKENESLKIKLLIQKIKGCA